MSNTDKNKIQQKLRKQGLPGNENDPAHIQRRKGLWRYAKKVGAVALIGLASLGVANKVKNDNEAYKKSPAVTVEVIEGDTIYDIASRLSNGDPRPLVYHITEKYGTKIQPGQVLEVHIGDNPSEYGENLAHEQDLARKQLEQNQNHG